MIKNSTTREIIIRSEYEFLYPFSSLNEINKYKKIIKNKAKLDNTSYYQLKEKIFSSIRFIENFEIENDFDYAFELVKNIDKDDAIFLACCLKFNTILWSNDRALKKQNIVRVLNTKEILELIQWT